MGVVLVLADRFLRPAEQRGFLALILLLALVLAGTAIYWACAHLLGAPEPSELLRVARKRRT
jgi:hypothetical protein